MGKYTNTAVNFGALIGKVTTGLRDYMTTQFLRYNNKLVSVTAQLHRQIEEMDPSNVVLFSDHTKCPWSFYQEIPLTLDGCQFCSPIHYMHYERAKFTRDVQAQRFVESATSLADCCYQPSRSFDSICKWWEASLDLLATIEKVVHAMMENVPANH